MDPNLNNHDQNETFENDVEKIDLDDIKGKIFIGGLSWQTSEANLRYYFEKFGELSDVALMIDKRTGKPRGFGFIKMKDPAAADIVMSTEHTIDGRLVDVKRALPRDKAPGPTRSEACKIFVGGLAPEITEKEFGDYFSKFGIVKDAVVMVDRNTGSSRGFGFVTFEGEETVESVMKIQHEIMGKYVEIKRAEPRDARAGFDAGMGGGGMGYGGAGMGGYGGRGGGMGGYGGRGPGMGMMGGGGMQGQMGMMGGRYGGRGGMGMGGDGYGMAQGGQGGYGGYMSQGMRGAPQPGAAAGGYNRYPSGYGGAAYGGRGAGGAGGYGGMSAPSAGYGYPGPSAMSPQAAMGGYYGASPQMGATGGYAGYGSAPGTTAGAAVQPSGYGGAAQQYSPNGGRPGASPDSGDFSGSGGDYRGGAPQAKAYDNSAIAAGYANAAAMQMRAQQQQSMPQQQAQYAYGGAAAMSAPQGYGGAYGVYGAAGSASPQPQQQPGGMQARMPSAGGPQDVAGAQGGYGGADANYGAYRGQGAPQGRVDRSYRPY